jgi:predicted transcriptional regulator
MTNTEMPKGRSEKINGKDIVEAAKQINEPCFSSREIAEELSVSTQTVRNKIDGLIDDGVIASKKIGNASAYWLVGY